MILGKEHAENYPDEPATYAHTSATSSPSDRFGMFPPSCVEATPDAWARANHFRVS